jgi:hypothetical protein
MRRIVIALTCILACARVAAAAPIVLYSNLALNGQMAAAGRPDAPGVVEIEPADDFILNNGASVTEVKFIGLIVGAAPVIDPASINLEIYRVFPADSTFPPDNKVPTRVNSPSDVAATERGFAGLTSLTITNLGAGSAANSVKNGIAVGAGGEGGVTGTEFEFDAVLATPFLLPADHYFFVPQLAVTGGDFYWLSASRPIVPPGTPINPDLQAWIRNTPLDPDWLRIGTDIIGGATPPTFNMAFELDGVSAVPEPATLLLFGTGLGLVVRRARRSRG